MLNINKLSKKEAKFPGIYCIFNNVNTNIYIGSACNIHSRWQKHLSDFKLNKHRNDHIQKAYNKYGKLNFSLYVLEFVENKNVLLQKEQYYFDKLNPDYNICKMAGSPLNAKHSIKRRLKIKSVNTSGYPGVSSIKHSKKYRARITFNDVNYYIGSFETPEKAFEKYKEALLDYHLTGTLPKSHVKPKIRSEIKGVHWCSRDEKWIVGFKIKGKLIRFGYFNDQIEAEDCCKKQRIKYNC